MLLRVTRLHLILAGMGIVCLFFGALNWVGITEDAMGADALEEARAVHRTQEHRINAAPVEKAEQMKRSTAQVIATVGEAYRVLTKQYGEIAPVARPLRAAKRYQAQGKTDLAQTSATEAWSALKM